LDWKGLLEEGSKKEKDLSFSFLHFEPLT
jgi:hypothetical protein